MKKIIALILASLFLFSCIPHWIDVFCQFKNNSQKGVIVIFTPSSTLDTAAFYSGYSNFSILPSKTEPLYKYADCLYDSTRTIVYMHVIDADSARVHIKDKPYLQAGKMILRTSVIDHSKIKPSDVLVYP